MYIVNLSSLLFLAFATVVVPTELTPVHDLVSSANWAIAVPTTPSLHRHGRHKAMGINCHGSIWCWKYYPNEPFIETLIGTVLLINSTHRFFDGEQIACYPKPPPKGVIGPTGKDAIHHVGDHHICAYVQNTPAGDGATGKEIKDVVKYLGKEGAGCRMCGSVPLGYPDMENVWEGELTFNWVSEPACGSEGEGGLCRSPGGPVMPP